jgi:hypothetical protein
VCATARGSEHACSRCVTCMSKVWAPAAHMGHRMDADLPCRLAVVRQGGTLHLKLVCGTL